MSDGNAPRCPRCSSIDVERHKQEPPARDYCTCRDCGKAGCDAEFRPAPVPEPRRPGRVGGLLPALVMAEAAIEGFGGLDRMMRISNEVLNVGRADRGRVK